MANASQYGQYVPTTNIWDDASLISQVDVNSEEFKQLMVRLYQNINNIALSLNNKDSAFYDTQEFVTGGNFFPPPNLVGTDQGQQFRPVYRKVIQVGALANAGTTTVAHGITCTTSTSFTRIYGVANKPTVAFSYIPLPFASPVLAENIKVEVDGTNVTITTGNDRTAYTKNYIVLEYLQI